MAWFSNWWSTLALTEQILYCIAIPSTLLLIIQSVLIIIGGGDGGTDLDFDADLDAGGMAGGDSGEFVVASMFTLQGIASFFCVLGWGSLFMYRGGIPLFLSIIIGAALGFGVMFLLAKIMFYLTKLSHSGTLEVKNLLGSMGTVYLRIPPKGEGRGRVMVQTSERLVEFDAVSETEDTIPNNAEIRVIDILGENVLVVERQ